MYLLSFREGQWVLLWLPWFRACFPHCCMVSDGGCTPLSGCSRTIYVCDDGKDRKKRRLCQRLGRDCVYVSGRKRASGEINGKSGNLNNACRQIYPDGCSIPAIEVICVMDADQVRQLPYAKRGGGQDTTTTLHMYPVTHRVRMVTCRECAYTLTLHGCALQVLLHSCPSTVRHRVCICHLAAGGYHSTQHNLL